MTNETLELLQKQIDEERAANHQMNDYDSEDDGEEASKPPSQVGTASFPDHSKSSEIN